MKLVVKRDGIGEAILKNLAAMKIARKDLQNCLQGHETCSFENTLAAHKKTYERMLKQAKDGGFKLCLLYVGLSSAKLAIFRVHSRVLNGGHGVSEELIHKRYDRILTNLYELINIFDSVSVYDNSGQSLIYQREGNKHFAIDNLPKWAEKAVKYDQQMNED